MMIIKPEGNWQEHENISVSITQENKHNSKWIKDINIRVYNLEQKWKQEINSTHWKGVSKQNTESRGSMNN